jgi:hypothetical protein
MLLALLLLGLVLAILPQALLLLLKLLQLLLPCGAFKVPAQSLLPLCETHTADRGAYCGR